MPRSLPTSVTQVLQQRRWTAIEARIVLDSISRSGLTIAQFARAHDVDYQRLNAWRRRLSSTASATVTMWIDALAAAADRRRQAALIEVFNARRLRCRGRTVVIRLRERSAKKAS